MQFVTENSRLFWSSQIALSAKSWNSWQFPDLFLKNLEEKLSIDAKIMFLRCRVQKFRFLAEAEYTTEYFCQLSKIQKTSFLLTPQDLF